MKNDLIESELHHPETNKARINAAVGFIRKTVEKFDIPELVQPSFSISEEIIKKLEIRTRETLIKNHNASEVVMGDEWYKNFLEHSVRVGLNCMLKDENHPILKYYLKQIEEEKAR